jgi:undecaprenyl-diphosphatase
VLPAVLQTLQSIDFWLFDALTPVQSGWLDTLMSWISISGSGSTIWVIIGLVAFSRQPARPAAWRLLLTLLLCYITVDLVLKPIVARSRPPALRAYDPPRAVPPVPRSQSFPSGHTAAAFGAATALSRMWPAYRFPWWALAAVMGYSRIYLGHHYPLDVAAGAGVGWLVALWVLGGRHPSTYVSAAANGLASGRTLPS